MAMNNVYSTLELAKRMAEERSAEEDIDVYVYECRYPSGVEYHLKTEKSDKVVFAAEIGYGHKFKPTQRGKKQAFAYAIKFEKELNRSIFVTEQRREVNGYQMVQYYYLTQSKDV